MKPTSKKGRNRRGNPGKKRVPIFKTKPKDAKSLPVFEPRVGDMVLSPFWTWRMVS